MLIFLHCGLFKSFSRSSSKNTIIRKNRRIKKDKRFSSDVGYVSRRKKQKDFKGSGFKVFNINATIDANFSRGFEVHFLMIYDAEFAKIVQKSPVLQYAEYQETFARENQHAVSIYRIEILPGKSYPPIKIPIRSGQDLVDCIAFVLIRDKDVPKKGKQSPIKSENIVRSAFIGNLQKIKLLIDRTGVSFS